MYFFMIAIDLLTKFLFTQMETIYESPGIENRYYNDNINYQIHPDIIFVYGSNLAGRHGKGAALQAQLYHGAIYGIGTGLINNSYGIPTKDRFLRILDLETIEIYVKQFVRLTNICELDFFVTSVGTGLAGYKHEDIAPMFKGVRNCWLPNTWKSFIQEDTV